MSTHPVIERPANHRRQRALVTGCAGFIGSHLCERLLADGHEVVGLDCFTDYYPRSVKEANLAAVIGDSQMRMHEADIVTTDLDEILSGVDTVYHLAAQAGVRGSFGSGFDTYVHHNIVATQRLLEAATRNRIARFVYASSSSVYGNAPTFPTPEDAPRAPVSPYGMTKCATEDLAGVYARDHDLHCVGLRYFTAYGPRQRPDMAFTRFISAALSDSPIRILGDGLQRRDFTFVGDVVEATVRAARYGHPGAVYNIGGGRPVPLIQAVRLIEETLGRKIEIDYHGSARGDARNTGADSSLAESVLGFAPTVSLEEGIAAQAKWLAEREGLLLHAA